MKESVRFKLEQLSERHQEVGMLLSDPNIISQQNKFTELSREYSQLEPISQAWTEYCEADDNLQEAEEMMRDSDPDMQAMAKEEKQLALAQIESLDSRLQLLLLPKDPNDESNIFLEIRAGTGGDEAAIFSGDLLRMYTRFAESNRWTIEILSANAGEHGGFKEVIARIVGQGVYSKLKFESGAHRVQRVPDTESQGRIHTSACTVAVLPETARIDEVTIKTSDLKIDTFRASGAGGQHVNTTDSAIRITHLPTGTVVECQDERSQHKNKARALSLLQARILDAEQRKQHAEQAADRKLQVGSGDRSQRIRTYNFPQGRVTDHRINLTLYKLDEFMTGDLSIILDPLAQEHQADLLAELAGKTN